MKKKTRGPNKKKTKPEAVAPGTANLDKFINDMMAEEAIGSEKLDTKESVSSFVDSMMSVAEEKKESNKKRAREKSNGATGGISKSLDASIKKLINAERLDKADISKNKRAIEENRQTIQRQAVSISVMQQKMEKISHQAALALSAVDNLNRRVTALQEYIAERFKNLEDEDKKPTLGDRIDAAVGSGLKKFGHAVKRGIKAAPGILRTAAGPAALGAAGIALYNMRQETLESDLGAAYEKGDLNKIKNQAIRQGQTGMLANDAELQQLVDGGPELAKDILESGGRDVERYGKQNLEKLAAGEKLSVQDMKKNVGDVGVTAIKKQIEKAKELGPAKGPQESAAVKAARAETGAPATIDSTTGKQLKTDAKKTAGSGAGSLSGIGRDNTDTTGLTGVGETASTGKAMQMLVDRGWTVEQAAGIVGNLQMESGPNMKTNAVGDGGKAYGIAQWHPDRQDRFKQQYKKDIREAGFEEQLNFLDWEIKNVELQALKAMKEAKTAREAAIAFDQFYERSSGAHRAQRIANAEALMKTDAAKTTASTESKSTPMTAPEGTSAPDAVPVQERGVSPPGEAASKNPTAGEAKNVSAGYKETTLPPNVKLGSGVNISSVDKDLLSKFFAAAAEYGKPVTIESAVRDDKKQAELWVRGNILKEPGIYMPAAPKTGQKVNVNGKEYYVPGGGHGSAHSDGQAIDVPQAPQMASVLQKYGLTIPFGRSDPVHIQKVGYTAPVYATQNRDYSNPVAPRGRMAAMVSGPSALDTMSRVTMSSMSGGRGSVMPTVMGTMATTSGMESITGLLGTLAVGGAQSMIPQSAAGIVGLVGSLLNTMGTQNRGNNPQFNRDSYQDNQVPSALPPANILREVFGMEIETVYKP